jgi:hypothetical protein
MGLISAIAYGRGPDQQTGRIVAWLALFHGLLLVMAIAGWFLMSLLK